SSSTRAAPKLLRKPRMRIMGEAPFEAQRETRQREAHEEIEGSASEPRYDPIAQVDGGDGHALGELDHGDHAHERSILQERDEIVGERGQGVLERLRQE